LAIRDGDIAQAALTVRGENHLGAICGRVCSAPCEKECILKEKESAISIRALERFATDTNAFYSKIKPETPKGKKVAVVGSGPSGLMAACTLALRGFSVTVFEALHLCGGNLRYGVPEFRLPKKVLQNEIDFICSLGVDIQLNSLIGKTWDLEDLGKQGYSAICLAVGLAHSSSLGIMGENLGRVIYAEEFLLRVNLLGAAEFPQKATSPSIGNKVIIIGSKESAVDCARIAVRLGRRVTLVLSQSGEDMSIAPQMKKQMMDEGVHLEDLAKPLQILADNQSCVRGLKCQRMDFADPTSSGRWKLIPVKGSEFEIEGDTVMIEGARKPNDLLPKLNPQLTLNKDGTFSPDKNTLMTTAKGVFVCGEALSGPRPMVEAMGMAKKVCLEIEKYIENS